VNSYVMMRESDVRDFGLGMWHMADDTIVGLLLTSQPRQIAARIFVARQAATFSSFCWLLCYGGEVNHAQRPTTAATVVDLRDAEGTMPAGNQDSGKRWPRSGARMMQRTVLILAITVMAAWTAWQFSPVALVNTRTAVKSIPPAAEPETETDGVLAWRPQPGYAGSQACQNCHADQFETYLDTAHSRAMSEVIPDQEPPDATFEHGPSGRRYRAARRDGRLTHAESLLLGDGSEFAQVSLALRYRVGSGHFGRTYLCDGGGDFLVESPLTWYEPTRTWGMSPGYDNSQHQAFTRLVPASCLFCHVGQFETSTASDFRVKLVEKSIGCERCHGPGQAHVDHFTAGQGAEDQADPMIVNPRRLPRKLSEAVCQQCHLQGDIRVPARDVRMVDYRPGLPLEKFRCEFRLRSPGNTMKIVGHVEQMWQSACYRQTETLTCVTCHDPHARVLPADRAKHYRSICLACHENRNCKLPQATREAKSANDCVACHMPDSATEVPHVAFTHHHIGIHPLGIQPGEADSEPIPLPLSDLSQLSDADQKRAEALAWYRLLLRVRLAPQSPSAQSAGARVDKLLRQVPHEAVDVHVELARAELRLNRGDTVGAAEAAERALEFENRGTDEQARALVVLGSIEFGQDRFEEARDRFAKLVQLGRNARDWFYLGLCENNCGRERAAIRALEKSLEIDPSSSGTYEALAAIRHVRGEFDAEQRLRDALARLNRWESERGEVRNRSR
jgi:tetratricopeptide (TPR) repeat protein